MKLPPLQERTLPSMFFLVVGLLLIPHLSAGAQASVPRDLSQNEVALPSGAIVANQKASFSQLNATFELQTLKEKYLRFALHVREQAGQTLQQIAEEYLLTTIVFWKPVAKVRIVEIGFVVESSSSLGGLSKSTRS